MPPFPYVSAIDKTLHHIIKRSQITAAAAVVVVVAAAAAAAAVTVAVAITVAVVVVVFYINSSLQDLRRHE